MAQPITERSLSGYFHGALGRAAQRQGHNPQDATLWYLTDLLTRYARSEAFFDPDSGRSGIRPLALLYGEAMQANSESERHRLLQRLGDVALFVAGLFHHNLASRAVRRDYVVTMGGGAYAYLADNTPNDLAIFEELSGHFVRFVNMLSDLILGHREQFDSADILNLYSLWNDTGNAQAQRQLVSLGVSLEGGRRQH